jgi:hypothetical protein
MSAGELVEVVLEGHGFTFTVVRLPKEVIIDKLALVSPSTGIITRTDYQNFVFSQTILNLERIFIFMTEKSSTPDEYVILRDSIIDLSYEVNPGLNPNILGLTTSGIIKPAVLCENCKPLEENPDWDRVPDAFNPYVDIDLAEIMDDIEEYSMDEEDAPPQPSFFSDLEPPPHLETVVRKWDRTNLELEVKRYGKEDISALLKPTLTFPEEDNVYKIFIIQQTVVNAEHLFLLVESMNLTETVPIEIITDELYNICIGVNPFLKLEEIDLNDLRNIKPSSSKKKKKSRKRIIRRGSDNKEEDEDSRSFTDVTKTELLTLAARMKEKVIGQDEAIDKIVETVQISSCGLRDPEKPVAVYMLCGTTGIGKTLCAKVLAEELCGDRNSIVRIDCSEYTQAHDTQKLIGAPPSFIGHDDGGFLTNAIQKHPFSIVLFDEIEKAHSKFFDVLLQIMDDSRLTDGKGVVTSFKDCVILLTSNVGVTETESVKNTMGFGDAAVLTDDKQENAVNKALKKRFRPEFLNRVDSVINFKSLDKPNALKIAGLLLDKVASYLHNKDIKATFSTAVGEMVFEKGFSKKFGARPLERTIDQRVVKPLAQKILLDELADGDEVEVDFRDGELVLNVSSNEKLTGSN